MKFRNFLSSLVATAALMFAAVGADAGVVYTTAVKTARMQAVVTQIDSGGAAGTLQIGTTGMGTVLCTITLNYNPAGTVSSGVLTLAGLPKTCTAGASGTAAAARIRTSAGTDVITGLTVGTSASDLNLDNVTIASGNTITVTSQTFTHN